MKKILHLMLLISCCYISTIAQSTVNRKIKDFGAKGDGKTNDTDAFLKAAAFFNARGGNGILNIPKGIYIVGRQAFSNGDITKYAYTGVDILSFKDVNNLTIKGEKGAILKYAEHLKFGSYDPVTGAVFNNNNPAAPANKYAAAIGDCILLNNCRNITVVNLTLDGNNKTIQFGGGFDDKGIQLAHNGVYIKNCHSITISNVNAIRFGLDGITVTNVASTETDNIKILNCLFEYNCRQGLSWVGGNFLLVKNSQFNHTGKQAYFSPPGAGVDIEPEINSTSNGSFDNCQFIDNTGCGLVTAGGAASNCTFTNSTFWGTTNWSIWVAKPSFTFKNCKIYGGVIHGFSATTNADATRFISCTFEDKPYNGKAPYGKFLVENEGAWRMLFDSCTFNINIKPIAWINTNGAKTEDDKAIVRNSKFIINNKDSGVAVMRFYTINFKNNTVEFKDPKARERAYWAAPCCISAADRDATKIIYDK